MIKNHMRSLIDVKDLAKLFLEKPTNLTMVNANFGFDYKTHIIRAADTWADNFKKERIPTSRFVNISQIGDTSQGLPNMLPTFENFTKIMKDLDIGKNDHVVCYGDEGIVGPSRAWWMFKVFGFPNVQVMNGTYWKWKQAGYECESGEERWKSIKRKRKDDEFKFDFNKGMVRNMAQVLDWIQNDGKKKSSIVDARSEGRFAGEHPDPKGLKVGHIPGSNNINFLDFINHDDTYKSVDELTTLLKNKKVDLSKPVVTSCGSGMTSCVALFGIHLAGAKDLAVYDGSWSEWAKHKENPVEIGPPRH